MRLTDIQTPALILDRQKLQHNAERMARRVAKFSISLRPHLKTSKSIEVARLAHRLGAKGGAVSTLREAEYFFAQGFDDLQYAVCITPNKFARARRLLAQGAKLTVITDSVQVARELAQYAAESKVVFQVLVEVDSGEHRTGLLPDDPALLATARLLDQASHTVFQGLMTHAGHSYQCQHIEQIQQVANEERLAVTQAAEQLQQAGVPVIERSIGSTPTITHGESFDGITEVRPGVYLFGDLFQAGIGSCQQSDIAVSVLATVLSSRSDQQRLVIDAGALALSKDRSSSKLSEDLGYGLLIDRIGRPLQQKMIVVDVHQEHGEVQSTSPLPFNALQTGSLVRVLPNHSCITAAMYDRYYVVDGDSDQVVDTWGRTNGWTDD